MFYIDCYALSLQFLSLTLDKARILTFHFQHESGIPSIPITFKTDDFIRLNTSVNLHEL